MDGLAWMSAAPPALWLTITAAIGGLWARGAWRRWWHRRTERRTMRARMERGAQAEEDARGFLRKRGYRVLDEQVDHSWTVLLDGTPHEVNMRADYLVARGRRRYIAEVKSGRLAPLISTAATRRQLLEYLMAYPVDGVLLVDMEQPRIYEVRFPERKRRQRAGRLASLVWLALGALLGVALTALFGGSAGAAGLLAALAR